jgi:hypothetical protein
MHELTHSFALEKIGTGKKNDLHSCIEHKNKGIHQGVLMVRCQKDRLVAWNSVGIFDFYFPVIDPVAKLCVLLQKPIIQRPLVYAFLTKQS